MLVPDLVFVGRPKSLVAETKIFVPDPKEVESLAVPPAAGIIFPTGGIPVIANILFIAGVVIMDAGITVVRAGFLVVTFVIPFSTPEVSGCLFTKVTTTPLL